MNDRAPEVAAYFVERDADDIEPAELWIEILQRWPDLTVEEADRGARIAAEILAASIAEQKAERTRIKRIAAQQLAGVGIDDQACADVEPGGTGLHFRKVITAAEGDAVFRTPRGRIIAARHARGG